MKLPSFIFKNKEGRTRRNQYPWQWPLCISNTNTLSFRASQEMFKTVNSVFFDDNDEDARAFAIPESWFTSSSELSASLTTDDNSDELPLDPSTIRSERLFFEPDHTRSILKDMETEAIGLPSFEESCVAVAMDSADPYGDFRRSMEEMVESHGLRDWECLGELLSCYLKMNGKIHHGLIVGAFVDLLIGIMAIRNSSDHNSSSYLSAPSSFEDD